MEASQLLSVRADEQQWDGCCEERKWGHVLMQTVLSLMPLVGTGGPLLTWNSLWWDGNGLFFFYCPGESLQPAGLRKHARDFCHFCFLFLCCFLTSCSLQHLYCPIVSSTLCSPALPHTLSWLTCLIAYPFLLHENHISIWHKHDCCYNDIFCTCWASYLPTPTLILDAGSEYLQDLSIVLFPTNLLPIHTMSFKFGVL